MSKAAGGFEQAVRSREGWYRHKMGAQEAAGGHNRSELRRCRQVRSRWWQECAGAVEGQEVWEEWMGQTVEDTEWRGKAKGQWRAMEQAAVRRGWIKDMERGIKVYDRG